MPCWGIEISNESFGRSATASMPRTPWVLRPMRMEGCTLIDLCEQKLVKERSNNDDDDDDDDVTLLVVVVVVGPFDDDPTMWRALPGRRPVAAEG